MGGAKRPKTIDEGLIGQVAAIYGWLVQVKNSPEVQLLAFLPTLGFALGLLAVRFIGSKIERGGRPFSWPWPVF